jgi:TonB family protein
MELRRRARPSWISLASSLVFHVAALALVAHWAGESGGSAGDEAAASESPAGEMPAMAVKIASMSSRAATRVAPTASALTPRRPALAARTASADLVLPAPPTMAELPAATWEPEVSLDLASVTPSADDSAATSGKTSVPSSARKRSAGRGGTGDGSGAGGGIGKGSATAPRPLATRVPAYPWSARKSGVEGVVFVRVQVSESGRVEASSVYRSSGHRDLDAAALACVAKWSFSPGQSGGRPVAAAAVVRVAFRLES